MGFVRLKKYVRKSDNSVWGMAKAQVDEVASGFGFVKKKAEEAYKAQISCVRSAIEEAGYEID